MYRTFGCYIDLWPVWWLMLTFTPYKQLYPMINVKSQMLTPAQNEVVFCLKNALFLNQLINQL